MAGSYAHAEQFKRANRELVFLRTRLGRIVRDIGRKIDGDAALEEVFAIPLSPATRSVTTEPRWVCAFILIHDLMAAPWGYCEPEYSCFSLRL